MLVAFFFPFYSKIHDVVLYVALSRKKKKGKNNIILTYSFPSVRVIFHFHYGYAKSSQSSYIVST